ncbi:MAG: dephospho-CoA kinase [Nitrospinales bacterium]
MSLLVGLTGSMGSGKTRAANLFRKLGAHILDADAVCRALVKPGEPAWREIVERFGNKILLADDTLNRAELAKIVFAEPDKKAALENILHPRVFREEEKFYDNIRHRQPDALVIIDAALLIESGNYKKMDKVVVMSCAKDEQIRRLLARGSWSREDIEKRLSRQMKVEDKIKLADYVIHNDGSLEDLETQVESVFHELKNFV